MTASLRSSEMLGSPWDGSRFVLGYG
ncbi:hypothetical protein LINPERPRIM_LOCUS18558 [Linum perenne]